MGTDLKIEHIKNPKDIGIALKRLRKNAGLSQSDLSKLINMRQPTISDIENGRGTLDSFFKIIQALSLNLTLSNGSSTSTTSKKSKIKEMMSLIE